MKPTIEVLREARALIADEEHWSCSKVGHEDGYGDEAKRTVCIVGAINVAVGGWKELALVSGEYREAAGAAKVALRAQLSEGLMAFNDAEGRTLAEVHAAFDRAIAAEESA